MSSAPAAAPAATPQTLEQAIDALRISPALMVPLALCALVMLIDGYDLNAMPLAAPYVMRLWDIAPARFGIAFSAVLVGLGAGAVLIAPLGDRFGRRRLVISSTLAIALTTLGTATGGSVTAFAGWRLLTGIALGACLPNVTALTAELAPGRRRASIIVITSCGVSFGAMGAGIVAPWLVALGGWRMIFIGSGVVTLAIAAILFALLPESPKLLLAWGQRDRLEAFARRFGLGGDVAAWTPPPEPPARASMLAPLARPYWLASFVFIGVYTVNAMVLYMLSSWLPTLAPQAGFSVDTSVRLSAIVQAGGLAGGVILSWFLDRKMTVAALVGGYALVALALAGFGLAPASVVGWGLLLLIVGGGISGTHMALMAVGTSFYPPQMLSSAIGLAVAVARVGAIAGPMVGSWLVAAGASPALFFLTMIVPVLICAAFILLIPAVLRAQERTA